jgi:ankyrin repeat protein
MKYLLLTTIAAVVLVGCGPSVDIHLAAREGNIEAVKQAIDDGADLNAKDNVNMTPLHWAVNNSQKEIVELLIANGADVNAKTENGWTPLHSAAGKGYKEIAELLINKGANVNAKGSKQKETPLYTAASEGHREVAELLIDKGADVNAKDAILEETPLNSAAYFAHKEVVELLIAKGADVNAKDGDGFTPLHKAAKNGHKEIAELLISKSADVNTKGKYFRKTPLDAAITFKHTEIAALLRKHGGKTGAWFKAEESIHIAARVGHVEAIKKHLADSADVNAKDEDDRTPLDWAIKHKQTEIAALLRKHGAKTGEELKAAGK